MEPTADRRPPTADRRPPTADRRPATILPAPENGAKALLALLEDAAEGANGAENLTDNTDTTDGRLELRQRAVTECAGQLVTLLKNLREDLGWALEYADELVAHVIMVAPAQH